MRPRLIFFIPGLTAAEVDDFYTTVMSIDVLIKGLQETGDNLVVDLDTSLSGQAETIKALKAKIGSAIRESLGRDREVNLMSAG